MGNKSRGVGSGEKGTSAVSIVGCRSMQWGDEPELECSLDSWSKTSQRGPVHAPWYPVVKPWVQESQFQQETPRWCGVVENL